MTIQCCLDCKSPGRGHGRTNAYGLVLISSGSDEHLGVDFWHFRLILDAHNSFLRTSNRRAGMHDKHKETSRGRLAVNSIGDGTTLSNRRALHADTD